MYQKAQVKAKSFKIYLSAENAADFRPDIYFFLALLYKAIGL